MVSASSPAAAIATPEAAVDARQNGEPTLEYDKFCMLCEKTNGNIRFRFNPRRCGKTIENVSFTFTNGYGQKLPPYSVRRIDRPMPFPVQFPPQEAGMQAWEVKVEYWADRRRRELSGRLELYVYPVESRKRGLDNINISINTNIGNVSQASDVVLNQRGSEQFAKLISENDVIGEMNRRAMSDRREWTFIPLYNDSKFTDLPPMPANARTSSIMLSFGGRLVHFFANRTVKFGRKRECNDFTIRPPATFGEDEIAPYRRVSREHCFFEHSGTSVQISDGSRSPTGVLQPSSAGTFWNNRQITAPIKVPSGTSGVISFGGVAYGDALEMDLKACDSAKACAACPIADRSWSGDGSRPCLMISRTDGVAEKFVGLWSCFWLGEADPSFEGYVVFRKDGAFAYCREDGQTGWLAPGTTVQTDFGNITVN
ncbi:MAG: FHA domain-containing protein [Kiritimatiellae bacterium]|nr:FHA domain-containing protein [Kiritimatiellia bacterium]